MTLSHLADEDVQLSLLSAAGHAGLAAALLTNRFGLSPDYAYSIVHKGRGLLISRLDRPTARAALPLLSAAGLLVAIQPCESLPPDEFRDLSVRIADERHARNLIDTLDRLIGLTGLDAKSFGGPEGHVIRFLSPPRADWLGAELRKLNGVSTVTSEHQTALYDLFAQTELTEDARIAVGRYLRLSGCNSGGLSDALGSGLDRGAMARVMERFPGVGLVSANQLFQRHDLLIIGKGSLSQQELVDFLRTRQISQSGPTRNPHRNLPLRVESFLTRKAASQFLADYTAIGMQAVTQLVHRAEVSSKSA